MYGVPSDLDLRRFQGDSLIQIALGEWQIQFRFQSGTNISVEGHWELKNSSGVLMDKAMENAKRENYKIHCLLGRTVLETMLEAPTSFTLVFDNGMSLTIFDDSEQYESFSIQPGNIFV
jgi:hypothetical protein